MNSTDCNTTYKLSKNDILTLKIRHTILKKKKKIVQQTLLKEIDKEYDIKCAQIKIKEMLGHMLSLRLVTCIFFERQCITKSLKSTYNTQVRHNWVIVPMHPSSSDSHVH